MPFPGFGRLVPALTTSVGLGAFCYGPAWRSPRSTPGRSRSIEGVREGYLVNRWAYRRDEPPRLVARRSGSSRPGGRGPGWRGSSRGPASGSSGRREEFRVDGQVVATGVGRSGSPGRPPGFADDDPDGHVLVTLGADQPDESSGAPGGWEIVDQADVRGRAWADLPPLGTAESCCDEGRVRRESGLKFPRGNRRVGSRHPPVRRDTMSCGSGRHRRHEAGYRFDAGRDTGPMRRTRSPGPRARPSRVRRPRPGPVHGPTLGSLAGPIHQGVVEQARPDRRRRASSVAAWPPTRPSDRDNLLAWRGPHSAIFLNRYPYNNGHLLVAPVVHQGTLGAPGAPT